MVSHGNTNAEIPAVSRQQRGDAADSRVNYEGRKHWNTSERALTVFKIPWILRVLHFYQINRTGRKR